MSERVRWGLPLPVLLGIGVFAFCFLVSWGWLPHATLPDQVCPTFPAAPSYVFTFHQQLWPPGTTRCDVIPPSGGHLGSGTYVPWGEWISALFYGLAVAVFAWDWRRWLLASVVVVAGVAWFVWAFQLDG